MVQQTILGSVALGLQGAEERLLGAKDLNRRGRVLGQVGQAAGMRDQPSTDDFAYQGSQVGSDDAHLGHQVVVKRLAVLGELDDSRGEGSDILHVSFGDLLTHAVLGGINDVLGNALIILDKGSQIMQALLRQRLLVLDEKGHLSITLIVGDNLDQLGEVPRVPLAHTHRESVDGLVELVQNGNSLDDVVVVTLHRELDLGTRVSVTKTQLGSAHITLTELLQQLVGMETDPTEQILNDFTSVAGLTIHEVKGGFNTAGQGLICKTQDYLLLLVRLGEVQFQERHQGLGCDTFGDVVDFAQCLLVVSSLVSREDKKKELSETYSKGRKLESSTILPNLARSLTPSWTSFRLFPTESPLCATLKSE